MGKHLRSDGKGTGVSGKRLPVLRASGAAGQRPLDPVLCAATGERVVVELSVTVPPAPVPTPAPSM